MTPKQTLTDLKKALEAKGFSGKLMTPEQYKAMVADTKEKGRQG